MSSEHLNWRSQVVGLCLLGEAWKQRQANIVFRAQPRKPLYTNKIKRGLNSLEIY